MTKKRTTTTAAKRILYFAYGANTNVDSMASRCPAAEPVGAMILEAHKLKFAGVADVVQAESGRVAGALWWITPACERSLDRFEGFPNLYVKAYGTVKMDGAEHVVMFYVMRKDSHPSPPSAGYLATLRQGYRDFDLPQEQLDLALADCPQPIHRFRSYDEGWFLPVD